MQSYLVWHSIAFYCSQHLWLLAIQPLDLDIFGVHSSINEVIVLPSMNLGLESIRPWLFFAFKSVTKLGKSSFGAKYILSNSESWH